MQPLMQLISLFLSLCDIRQQPAKYSEKTEQYMLHSSYDQKKVDPQKLSGDFFRKIIVLLDTPLISGMM